MNKEDTESKSDSSKQSSNQLDSRSTAIRQQIDSNYTADWTADKTANRQQLDSKKTAEKFPLDSNYTADWTADKTADRQQLDSKKTAIMEVSNLTGKEAQLVKIIFQNCQNSGSLETPNLTTENLRQSLEVTTKRLGNLVERLIKKKIFEVIFSKRGNSGFRRFRLHPEHYQKLVLNQKDSRSTAIRQQKDSNYTADWTADKTAQELSSSSSDLNINNKTTTTKLPKEWETIKTPQNIKDIGLVASHIRQIHKNGVLEAQEVQDSLNAFSHDLENGKVKARNGSLNLLMGVLLKKGMYISEDYLTESKKEIDAYLTKVEELEAAKEKLKEINKQKKFEKWLETLSDERKNEIVPPNNLIKAGGGIQMAMLKSHWEKEHE